MPFQENTPSPKHILAKTHVSMTHHGKTHLTMTHHGENTPDNDTPWENTPFHDTRQQKHTFQRHTTGKHKFKGPPSWICTDMHTYVTTGVTQFFSFNQTFLRAHNLIFYSDLNFDILINILVMFSCKMAALDVVL